MKGFAILLLILIPFAIFSARRQRIIAPKILYFSPTPPQHVSQTIAPTTITPWESDVSNSQSSPTPQSPLPTSVQQNTTGDFTYPNSTINSQNGSSLLLDSTDDAGQITNWYKNKITQMEMNTTSFITTNTNDTISNKLVAAKGSQQVQVEITKSAGDPHVKIKITQ